ncbi:putative transcription factor NAM family [Helianthus annuus]|uniref:Transcription factor NAM family n=1 Tax=Helianthus annuus TaxID=4232 RepID=A0A9K3P2P9_HELAN|nr:putative transcription factor NAM family [Helianthus annuus]KAJ0901622.1 putative transcription factor NAM family [Helianthus annuus]KAJ0953320.1 putative transcription factor NAM family [Helianthus annuus]
MESDKFYRPFKDRSTMLVDEDFQIFNRCPIHLVDEELIGYYLKGKVQGLEIELEVIPLVELFKCDPWGLPGELCFFSNI